MTEEREDQPAAASASLIFLIGLRGSGKTTVARLLAECLHWSWVDADEVLEQRYGQSIRTIFASEGETGFRDKETTVLADLCQRRRHVIATGGGVILRDSNRERLRTFGWVVYLRADVETLWQRVCADATTAERRPMLTIGGREEIAQVLRAREALYQECADAVVAAAERTPMEIVAEIMRRKQERVD